MVAIDSYKISLGIDALKDVNFGKFDRQINVSGETADTELLQVEKAKKDVYFCVNPGYGIKRIEINETGNRVILQGSAKILKEQYFEGINLNTWKRVIEGYNNTGYVKLDPVEVLNNAELFSVDVSANMTMTREPWQYIKALRMLQTNERYEVKEYRNPGSKDVNGVTFRGVQRSFKERQIYYDKQKDVAREPELRQYIGKYNNVLRVEMNLQHLRRIRHYFGKNTLQDVLHSKANANYQLFEKINSKASMNLLRLFNDFDGIPLYQVEKIKGRETIIRDICLMDWDMVVQWIKVKLNSKKPYRYINEYRELFNSMLAQSGKVLDFSSPLLDELSEQLKKIA